ncbi:MAG: GTP-binding protein [Acetobacteraceae bacterium]|nr:GTP-binding protein [Acetobacteraceae bacterium]
MIPVSVVTGFLGSGKTTLIRRLLSDPSLSDTAVIVNEFGEIGLDHDLISSATETLLTLTTGCLCCAIRTDLVQTLLDLDARQRRGEIRFARVLVETSGLADPAPILAALMTDPALAGRFAIAAIATLVDAELGQATLSRHPEARRQVAMADRILLTKTDRTAATAELRARLAALNPAVTATPGPGDAQWLLAPPGPLPADVPPIALHTAAITTATIRRTEPVPALALTLLLQSLAEHCGPRLLRLKGIVDLAESPGHPAVIHGVQHVFSTPAFLDAWPTGDHTTRIVLIGEALPPHFAARLLDTIIAEVQDEQARATAREPPAP